MNAQKTLIAFSVLSILAGSAWGTVNAKLVEEDDSVRQWGRWAVLAPAAGQEEAAGFTLTEDPNLGSCESAANCPTVVVLTSEPPTEEPPVEDLPVEEPPLVVPPPLDIAGLCESGMPCGFARIDFPYDQSAERTPRTSYALRFELSLNEEDGTLSFVVAPRGNAANAIRSDVENAIINPADVQTILGSTYGLAGLLVRDDSGQVVQAEGMWNDFSSERANGGEFVWGLAANAEQIQALMGTLGADMIASYEGITMGVTSGNEGSASIQINFATATWEGQFSSAIDFTASGPYGGAAFVSNPDGFSDNIVAGELKGGVVNAGNNAIGAFEVKDTTNAWTADAFNAVLVR